MTPNKKLQLTMIEKLQGVWQSDADMTLDSMRGVTGMSPRAKAMLEDDFFGRLVVEYQGQTRRAYLQDDDYDTGFEPFEIIDERAKSIVLREWNVVLDDYFTEEIHFEDSCYYVFTGKPIFREYFCRVRGDI